MTAMAMRWVPLLAVAAACGPAMVPPVEVQGARDDVSALAGAWAGEYESPQAGRGGSIVFRLSADGDTAVGDVVMMPRAGIVAVPPPEGDHSPVRAAPPRELTIRFVRVDGGRVTGTLDPYADPDCGCAVTTTFEGTLRGDVIEGTFITRGPPPHGEATGTWRVQRTRA